MKSKIMRLQLLAALLAATSSYCMHIDLDLALPLAQLEQQLTALNQAIPTKQLQLINFDDATIRPFLLTQELNDEAPAAVPLILSKAPHVELVQLLVAWQDLPLRAFLDIKQGIIEAEGALLLHGYKDIPAFINKFKFFNPKLEAKLKELKGFYEKYQGIDPLLGGGDASCGYHALKNTLLITNALYSSSPATTNNALENLMSLNLTNDLFGKSEQNEFINGYKQPGIWRQFMLAHPINPIGNTPHYDQVKNPTAEWLSQAGIAFLWSNSISKELVDLFAARDQKKLYDYLYKYRTNLNHELIFFAKNFTVSDSVKKKFDTENKAFFIINAGGNHWLTLFVSRVGTTTQCIILDSKNWPRYDLPEIHTIIKALTGATVPAPSAAEIVRRKKTHEAREKILMERAVQAAAQEEKRGKA